ncbi:MAG: PDZ domain-containing protein [Planctomycetes bacterium]|nr:PDZ domain-containing protein [Planctomycetota bacterium]MCP4838193.1 PDZ domain-containing protein [Planctomycetota bacterium]
MLVKSTTAVMLGLSSLAWAHPHSDQAAAFANQLSEAFQNAAEIIKPSVVHIGTIESAGMARTRRGHRINHVVEGTGSGVIVSTDGLIVTNHHVIAGVDQIIVTLHDGSTHKAKSLGIDRGTDLAIIKIDGTDLTPAAFTESDGPRVGQWVLAVGSPFGLSQSFSAGIISATGRSGLGLSKYERLIQTDAAINPGSSGGPLIDLQGRIVGINSSIKSATGTHAGIGFAIPSAVTQTVTASLIERGFAERGFFGVTLASMRTGVDSPTQGSAIRCVLTSVGSGTPAQQAGLRHGDIVVSIDGRDIHTADEAVYEIAACTPGESCEVNVLRNNAPLTLCVIPTSRRAARGQRP